MSLPPHRAPSDRPFLIALVAFLFLYVLLIVAMLGADASFTTPDDLWAAMRSPEIRYATTLSLVTATLTAILSVWFAVPIGYVMSRFEFRGRALTRACTAITSSATAISSPT